VLGVYDVYGGNLDAALRNSTQIPVNDPCLLVPAMAMVTEHLGFGITCTLPSEPPYPFARRMSSLDHLTNGRVGWNIVTGFLSSAARGVSGADQSGHDTRYESGDEYVGHVQAVGRQLGRWSGCPRPGCRHLHPSREGS
jgi:long-chain alkane monooxygenase